VSIMALRTENLVFGFGRDPVVRGVSIEVPAGTVCAVVGPNGSGKSTLLRTISGYLRPEKGVAEVYGIDVHKSSFSERSRLITYSGDEAVPSFGFSVEETVLLGRYAARPDDAGTDGEAAEKAMKLAQVWDLRDRSITELSSGERQRVYLARAVCQDPQVFLLDEPTAHLDLYYEIMVMELMTSLASSGKTFVAVIHDLNLALRHASRLLFMKDGKVVASVVPDDLTPDIVRAVYGVDALVTRHDLIQSPIVVPLSRSSVP
jgi:iron complex transport system ATP-binding protein